MPGIALTELVLLLITITTAIVAVRVLLDISSRKHRRRYSREVKWLFALGVVLGVSLPWNEQLGLAAALTASIFLLLLALGYYLIGGRRSIFKFLSSAWTPREHVRDWYLYLSITTGVTGVVSTILSVVVPPFLSLTISSFIPIAFSTVSVLSALLEFTLYVPPYQSILGLTYNFTLRSKVSSDTGEPYVEDLDFPVIAEGTTYTTFDVRDAMESLVGKGFASKVSPTPLGKVGFRLNEHGMRYLQAVWNETYALLSREKGRIESEVMYLFERLRSSTTIDKGIEKRARDEIDSLRKKVRELAYEYGVTLEKSWIGHITERLGELENSLFIKREPTQDKMMEPEKSPEP